MWSIDKGVGLRELRALLAVADLGSFRRAATELGYTQSSISHQVATLERALGTELFTRPGGRGAVKLTSSGTAAYRRARRAPLARWRRSAPTSTRPGAVSGRVFGSASHKPRPPSSCQPLCGPFATAIPMSRSS